MFELSSKESEFLKVIEKLKSNIQSIRTNRSSANLVSGIMVNVYETRTPLEQLASISAPDPRTLVIQPWDKSILKDIESALVSANLGTMPTVKEDTIFINLPPLNEEMRKKLVKILNEKLEEAKVVLRNIRDEIRAEIIKEEKNKAITEDDKYSLLESLDEKVFKYKEEISLIGERKEKEIMTI
ncbi:MAG: ribosome recycling factor [Patescibacteria group bacterium]